MVCDRRISDAIGKRIWTQSNFAMVVDLDCVRALSKPSHCVRAPSTLLPASETVCQKGPPYSGGACTEHQEVLIALAGSVHTGRCHTAAPTTVPAPHTVPVANRSFTGCPPSKTCATRGLHAAGLICGVNHFLLRLGRPHGAAHSTHRTPICHESWANWSRPAT